MPTSKPRVAVTLDAVVFDQVKAIAKAENRSMANLIEMWVLAELAKRWTAVPASGGGGGAAGVAAGAAVATPLRSDRPHSV